MNSSITFQYPTAFILLCVIVGVVYAVTLYFRDKRFESNNRRDRYIKILLGVLRFVVVTLIAILLLSPFIKNSFEETEKPIIVLMNDNSESVKTALEEEKSNYLQDLDALKLSLASNYDLRVYNFGENLEESDSLGFDDKVTDISSSMRDVTDLYSNQNVGAIILATDGIYNKGSNPVYGSYRLTVPVHTIALGDTSIKKDLRIDKAYYNRIVYLGDRFKFRVDLTALNADAAFSNVNLTHIKSKQSPKILDQSKVSVTGNNYTESVEFELEAKEVGLQHYRVSLASLKDEATLANNSLELFIDVLDGREKVLIVANAPHPDVTAIKQAIITNKNYEAELIKYKDALKKNLEEYNLVVLHQLPSRSEKAKELLNKLKSLSKSTFFILGSSSDFSLFNNSQNIMQIASKGGTFNDALPVLSTGFNLFTMDEPSLSEIEEFPPLKVPFADYKLNPNASVLLYQKIGAVKTNYPLLALGEQEARKIAVLSGDGYWRWRTSEYMRTQEQNASGLLLTKIVQYLSVKEDKRQFRVRMDKNLMAENEAIYFSAELYNDSYELINSPDVSMKITDEEAKEYPFVFNKTENAYELNAGYLPVGNYSFYASTLLGPKNLDYRGQFSVKAIQLESLSSTADHRLLHQISSKFGGEMFFPKQLNELYTAIESDQRIKPVLYNTFKTSSVINMKWLLFLFIGLLAIEWFIRKYLGAY